MKVYKVSESEFINVEAIKRISIKEDVNKRTMTEEEAKEFGEEFKRFNCGIYVFNVDVRAYLTMYPDDEGVILFTKIFECPAYMTEKPLFTELLANTPSRDKIISNQAYKEKYSKYISLMQQVDEQTYVQTEQQEAHDILYPAATLFLEDFIKNY